MEEMKDMEFGNVKSFKIKSSTGETGFVGIDPSLPIEVQRLFLKIINEDGDIPDEEAIIRAANKDKAKKKIK
ncbi:MAG: hypothetical protein WCS34_05170 [Bacteroidales bacterium]